jgi:hypothetical protein
MNKKILFFLFLILNVICTSSVNAQSTDWVEYGVRGKVKVRTTLRYQLKNSINKNVPVDTTVWYSKEIMYFNKKGKLDSLVNEYNSSNNINSGYIVDSSQLVKRFTQRFFYDQAGKKRSGLELEYPSKQEQTVITYSWLAKNMYVQSKMVKGDEHALPVDSIWLGKNGRDSVRSTSQYLGTYLMKLYRFEAFYDESGERIRAIEQEFLPFDERILTYEITSRDKKGNGQVIWITSNKLKDPTTVERMYYEYY